MNMPEGPDEPSPQGSIVVRVVEFATYRDVLRKLRFEVFVDGQGVPPEIEMDDRDEVCMHVLATDADLPVGTGRVDLARGARIGRVAVLSAWRGRGIGSAIMHALHDLCGRSGATSAWCHAQTSASAFYERLGYAATGEVFEEAGIEHIEMRRSIPATGRRGGKSG